MAHKRQRDNASVEVVGGVAPGMTGYRREAAMRLLKLLLVLFACANATPADAGPREEATAALAAKDYATALRLLRPLADQGEAGAQFNLASMYGNGWGVPQDYATEAAWYRRAANQGHIDAQHILGILYVNGGGGQRDYVQAHMWFNIIASGSNSDRAEAREQGRDSRARVEARRDFRSGSDAPFRGCADDFRFS